jgi:hypothetical protein
MRLLSRYFLDQLLSTLNYRPIEGRDSKSLAYLDAILDYARRQSSAKAAELALKNEKRRESRSKSAWHTILP